VKIDKKSMHKGIDPLVAEMMENIAHQWRQPLAQINATVTTIDNILYENKIEDPRLEEKLLEIERLTKYMSNTIEDFRQSFQNQGSKNSISLSSLLEEVLEVVRDSFNDNNIEIIEDFGQDCEYKASANKLKQILVVLLNNAKDAHCIRNTFNAKVWITLEDTRNQYVIIISDNAGGITKSVQQKMFEPYYTTKHQSEGSGIGLYMAKKILEEDYNGSLSVKNSGDGSCFTIQLKKEGSQ
jgi:C4-dicarboxylate-specific signal transduction histidine kinase